MTWAQRFSAAGAILFLASALTSCSSTQQIRSDDHAPSEPQTQHLDEDCLSISDGANAKLAGKIADTVPGAEILSSGLVVSETGDMWIIAVKFIDPGLDQEFTGVWGSVQDLTITDDPAFVAVDEVAEASAEYLQPVDFDGIGAQLPSAEAAVACLA